MEWELLTKTFREAGDDMSIREDTPIVTAMSSPGLPSSQLRLTGATAFLTIGQITVLPWTSCLRTSIISALPKDDSFPSAYGLSLEEQIARVQSVVAYLLEKNEKLRLFIAAQYENS
jgi:hypothetical protein